MTNKGTDYTPGEDPVPVGTVVEYFDRKDSQWVAGHLDPKDRLTKSPPLPADIGLEEAYPDGVAYYLLPVGVPNKMGTWHYATTWVRRTSFRITKEKESS